jgi:Tfp pilus assembly protein PilX
MNPQNPVLTPEAIASAAGTKTVKVKRKLRAAEAELRKANSMLRKSGAKPAQSAIGEALAENTAAEQKVHEATDELEVVEGVLEAAANAERPAVEAGKGRSGQGVRSLIRHLPQRE